MHLNFVLALRQQILEVFYSTLSKIKGLVNKGLLKPFFFMWFLLLFCAYFEQIIENCLVYTCHCE